MKKRRKTKTTKSKIASIVSPKYEKFINLYMDANNYREAYNVMHNMYECSEYDYKNKHLPLHYKENIKKIHDNFISACCYKEPCMEFVNFLRRTDYNLEKVFKDLNVRPLYSVYHTLGLEKYLNIEFIPISVMNSMIYFGYYTKPRPILTTTKGCSHGDLILALLSVYSKHIAPNDYGKMWLVVSFVKTLSLLSSSSSYYNYNSYEEVEEIDVVTNNLFNLLDFILNDIIVKNVEGVDLND